MIVVLRGVLLTTAQLAQDQSKLSALIDTTGNDVASVEAFSVGTTAWSAGVLRVRKTNNPSGALYRDYSTVQNLTPTNPMTGLLAIQSQYLAIEITTAEASVLLDIYIHMRPSNIGSTVIT
jgi:hypothetical protein